MNRRIVLALVLPLFVSACMTYPGLRDANRTNLTKLRVGMSPEQAMLTMGTQGFGEVGNPYRQEQFVLGGNTYTVLFYYTDFIQDGAPMDTGMTPVVFRNGAFIGAGRTFLQTIR